MTIKYGKYERRPANPHRRLGNGSQLEVSGRIARAAAPRALDGVVAGRVLLIALAAVLLQGIAGCKMLGPRPTVAQVSLKAEASLNPDYAGRASPLKVRLYELKSVSAFNAADFFSLYERDKDVLAADLVAREEIQVEPGMQKEITRRAGPDTKFLAVLAAYRDIEHAIWRTTVELPPGKTTKVQLRVERLAVALSAPKKSWFSFGPDKEDTTRSSVPTAPPGSVVSH